MSAESPSSTPFALLLNAISDGDGQRHPGGVFGGDGGGEALGGTLDAGGLWQAVADGISTDSATTTLSGIQLKDAISALILSSIGTDSSGDGAQAGGMSTVEVWHPSTGQKSYGKERRILNPPPFLRTTGPISSLLTGATLSAVRPADSHVLSSQTHRIPLLPALEEEEADAGAGTWTAQKSKKAEREAHRRKIREAAVKAGFAATLPMERGKHIAREREALESGLAFAGLWVAEEINKEKTFNLELGVSEPGVEAPLPPVGPTGTETPAGVEGGQGQDDDPAAFLHQLHDIAQDSSEDVATLEDQPPPPMPPPSPGAWATFFSSPIGIVSKPSKKTAKARSTANCLSESSSFALWVRINSQTVRTKYMNLDAGDTPRLCARSGKWTPFHFEVIYRAPPPRFDGKALHGRFKLPEDDPHVVTYGSVVCLIDSQTGVRSEAMKLVRVDRNAVTLGEGDGDPISELQRVGFVRLEGNTAEDTRGGGRGYLSAPSARAGGGELLPPREKKGRGSARKSDTKVEEAQPGEDETLQSASERPKKRRKTQRNALAEAIVNEEQEGSTQSVLSWEMARQSEHTTSADADGGAVAEVGGATEQIEDHMCWIIGGVDSFKYSFHDAALASSITTHPSPLRHVPRALAPPTFQTESNSLEIVLSDFHEGLSVYIGPLGPLTTSLWRSSAPAEAAGRQEMHEAVPLGPVRDQHRRIWSSFPGTLAHVLLAIDMPAADQIIRAMQKLTNKARIAPVLAGSSAAATTAGEMPPFEPAHAEPWIPDFDVSHPHEMPTEAELQEVMAAVTPHTGHGDLEAALRAVDTSQFASFDEAAAEEPVDPALTINHGGGAGDSLNEAALPDHDHGTEANDPPALVLHVPTKEVQQKGELVSLPLLLVRKADAMIFGLGHSVTAKRMGSDEHGEPLWGLRVAETKT